MPNPTFVNKNQHTVYLRNEKGHQIKMLPEGSRLPENNPNVKTVVEGEHFRSYVNLGMLTEINPVKKQEEPKKEATVKTEEKEVQQPVEEEEVEETVEPEVEDEDESEDVEEEEEETESSEEEKKAPKRKRRRKI